MSTNEQTKNRRSRNNDKLEVPSELIFVPNEKDGAPLLCRVWNPPGGRVRGAVIFIHGGMFSQGNLNSHPQVSRTLALELKLAVITASFRDGSRTTYSTGETMTDLLSIARYFRSQHSSKPFGIVGSSSGGWFALALANALERDQVDFVIPLCPVADPYARAVYLQHCIEQGDALHQYHVHHEPDRAKMILENQLRFFDESWSQMQHASQQVRSNRHGVPTLLIVGAEDANVPPQVTQHIQTAWATRTLTIGGAGHEIQNAFPTHSYQQDFVPDIDRFLKIVLREEEEDDEVVHSDQSRRYGLALLFLLVAVLLFALSWWLASTLYVPSFSQTPEWLAFEQGIHQWLYNAFRLVIGFFQMVWKGGARNRSSDNNGFFLSFFRSLS